MAGPPSSRQGANGDSSRNSPAPSPSLATTVANASSPSSSSLPIPQIPPHNATSSNSGVVGSPTASAMRTPNYFGSPRAASPFPPNAVVAQEPTGVDSPSASGIPLTDAQKAEVIRRHLLNADEQQRVALDQAASSSSPRNQAGSAFPQKQAELAAVAAATRDATTTTAEEGGGEENQYPTPYHLEGGDVVAGVYKWVAQQAGDSGISAALGGGPSGATLATGGAGGGIASSLRRSRSVASLPPTAGGGGGSRRTSLAANNGGGDAGRAAAKLALLAGDDAPLEDDTSAIAIVDDDGLTTSEMLQPGGFRRDFVFRRQHQQHANASGLAVDSHPGSDRASLVSQPGESSYVHVAGSGAATPNRPIYGRPTRSFIDFLTLYGHFGGEDLEEIEEEDDEDEEEEDEEATIGDRELGPDQQGRFADLVEGSRKPGDGTAGPVAALRANERTPLIRNRSSVRSNRSMSRKRGGGGGGAGGGGGQGGNDGEPSGMKDHGDATVTQAVMMLLKSFVGTGVLFLGKAFYNGGILFSVITLCFIAMVSLYSFLLLVQCSLVIPGSFGDIGGRLYGKYMRLAILFSIVLSQIGFVAAYTVFISQNLQAFFLAVTNCRTYISIALLITAQTVVFLPFALIRNIQKLSGTALVADVFIVVGLIYIFSNEIALLSKRGVADVKLFNSKDFPLLIGTAVFAFEGIGLILPVAESMREPQKFPRVLTGVMIGTMCLFAGGGALGYLTYGSKIQTVVFVNLPQDDKFVNASQFLYSIAILLSTPLQLFPAVRIMENGIFAPQKSGKRSLKVKWEKNAFRTLVVVLCALIAWFGAADLDKFVSLIGSLACVPLGLIYPALLHLKACARTRKQKAADIVLIAFGTIATVYTTVQTIQLLTSPSDGPAEPKPHCPPRQ